MKKGIRILGYSIMACLCFSQTACGSNVPDYSDSKSFEDALNNDEKVVGKIVTFDVLAVSPDTKYGYDIWSGDHLNFCSEEVLDVQRGDVLTVKIQSVASVGDSYIIRYKLLDTISREAENAFSEDAGDTFKNTESRTSPNDDARKNDCLLADSVHTAFLTAIMDPEVVNQKDYKASYSLLMDGMEITNYSGSYQMGENSIVCAAADILDLKTFASLSYMLQSTEATGKIYVTAIGNTKLRVEIDGTDIVIE